MIIQIPCSPCALYILDRLLRKWRYFSSDRNPEGNEETLLSHNCVNNNNAFQSKTNCLLANKCMGYKWTSLNRSWGGRVPSEQVSTGPQPCKEHTERQTQLPMRAVYTHQSLYPEVDPVPRHSVSNLCSTTTGLIINKNAFSRIQTTRLQKVCAT